MCTAGAEQPTPILTGPPHSRAASQQTSAWRRGRRARLRGAAAGRGHAPGFELRRPGSRRPVHLRASLMARRVATGNLADEPERQEQEVTLGGPMPDRQFRRQSRFKPRVQPYSVNVLLATVITVSYSLQL